MTISTPPAEARRRRAASFAPPTRGRERARAAFTLTEVIIAASLSTLVLAGILSTFLLLGRAGFNASAYAEMNQRLRGAVETFNRDVRLATGVRYHDERRLTLLLPAPGPAEVTYAFEPAADPAAPGRFVRQSGEGPAETLVAGVAPDFAFRAFRAPSVPGVDELAEKDREIRQLEVRLRAVRGATGGPAASQLTHSARCVLRNQGNGA